jgi:copper chaperone CopZ
MTVRADHRATVTVTGMSCEHCARSVTEELTAVNGVHSVDVTVSTGNVIILSDRPLERAEVAAAIDAAGYHLAD